MIASRDYMPHPQKK